MKTQKLNQNDNQILIIKEITTVSTICNSSLSFFGENEIRVTLHRGEGGG